jgi:Na+-transporting NADH:ubiquinone oxidoreductase subunit C
MNRQSLVYTVPFTFVVAFVFVALLALTNEATRKRTAENRQIAEKTAFLVALGIEVDEERDLPALYDSTVTEYTADGLTLYETEAGGVRKEAIRFSGAGLWGSITGVLAVDSGVSRILGLRIIDHNETPGLGGRIAEPWFQDQFSGEKIVDGKIRIRGSGDNNPDDGIVDAVTGATRTSQAMEVILNESIRSLQEALR